VYPPIHAEFVAVETLSAFVVLVPAKLKISVCWLMGQSGPCERDVLGRVSSEVLFSRLLGAAARKESSG
jgi:hypothetical protein